ncbi:MAG: dUTP diphosphatase [Bacilli bacterium]
MISAKQYKELKPKQRVRLATVEDMMDNGFLDVDGDIAFATSYVTFPCEQFDMAGTAQTLIHYDGNDDTWLIHTSDEWSMWLSREMIASSMVEPFTLDVACETSGSAGFDISASEAVTIDPGRSALVHTNLYFDAGIENDEYLAIMSRSGLALKKQVFVLNAPGIVDADYRGEICVILFNAGLAPFHVNVGDRVAQGVIQKHVTHNYVKTKDDVRGDAGFGSTGV